MHSTRSARDKVYQLLAHGRWFSLASSTTKTGRHDIAEILLKVVLKHQKSNQNQIRNSNTNPVHSFTFVFFLNNIYISGHHHMIVGFITTYAISVYDHSCGEVESCSGKVYSIKHYVIKFVSDL